MTTSGSVLFQPSLADLVIECYSRIQVHGPAMTVEHVVEARRSANLILQDWSANRSVNLFAVDLIQIPLLPGQSTYVLPNDTIQLLDVYLRVYTSAAASTTTSAKLLSDLSVPLQPDGGGGNLITGKTGSIGIGSLLTPMTTGSGVPMVTEIGDPLIVGPASGTLSSVIGSQRISLKWPAHGLSVGSPIFFVGVVSVGGLALSGMYIVTSVIDLNNVSFLAPTPAVETQTGQGAPPLFQTINGSTAVFVIYPNHGMAPGVTFNIPIATTIAGLTLSGNYTVVAVSNSYQFTITAASAATSSTAVFQNGGQIQLATQRAGVDPLDMVLYGISRSEYAAIPDKFLAGRPTTFWYDRVVPPTLTVWQPPDTAQSYSVAMYRMRQIQDANPLNGQTADMPNRFLPALAAELTAALAEKFKPEAFSLKLQLAQSAWSRAAQEDNENVPLFIIPGLAGYFR